MAENKTPNTGGSSIPPEDDQNRVRPDAPQHLGETPVPPALTSEQAPSGLDANHQLADNRQRITRLIELHHAELYGYAYRLTGVVADAEDLTQQVFLIAHRKLHQVRDEAATRGWLFQVLRSCFTKLNRRKRPTTAANVDLDVNSVAMEQSPSDDFDPEALQLALNTLSEEQRIVVTMFYFEDLSYLEIADSLKIAPGTVMSRLSRAKAKLKEQLADPVAASPKSTDVRSPLGPSSATGGC